MKGQVWVVDDDVSILSSLGGLFEKKGFQVKTFETGRKFKDAFKQEKNSPVVLLDIRLPDIGGMELLKWVKEQSQEALVVMITGYGEVSQSVEAMRMGAVDYVLKPFNIDELFLRVERAFKEKGLAHSIDRLQGNYIEVFEPDTMVASSPQMKKIASRLEKIAASPSSTVFISGETGTGKEVLARRLHRLSPRRHAPFIEINASAVSRELLESELFGHEAGSFTGATKTKPGLFEVASGGTLFLDEIGDMELNLQAKLLKVIEEKKIRRVGGLETIDVDIRLITATHQHLEEEVKNGNFREDLYYRLNVVPLDLPPLRERKGDIKPLALHFISLFNHELGKKVTGMNSEALELLENYSWPGNIRQLRNIMERTLLLEIEEGEMTKEVLLSSEPKLSGKGGIPSKTSPSGGLLPLETVEREHIAGVLESVGGNKNKAAQILGIDRTTLYNKIKKFELTSDG